MATDEEGYCSSYETIKTLIEDVELDSKHKIINKLSNIGFRTDGMTLENVINTYEKLDEGGNVGLRFPIDEEEYSISFKSKDVDILMGRLSEEQQEWASFLFAENVLYELYGGEYALDIYYNIPKIEGDFTREDIIRVAKSIIGHPYQWGGKYAKRGSPDIGLDCSGYVDWVFMQLTGKTAGGGGGTAAQFQRTIPISGRELEIGDLGFYYPPNGIPPDKFNHVGIYAGKHNGSDIFIHCGGRTWSAPNRPKGRVVITYNNSDQKYEGNTSSRFQYFRRVNIDYKN